MVMTSGGGHEGETTMITRLLEKLDDSVARIKSTYVSLTGKSDVEMDQDYDFASPGHVANRYDGLMKPRALNPAEQSDHAMIERVRAALYTREDA
jgi:hypothetical protein